MFLEEGSRQMSAGLSFGYRTINKLKNSLPYIYGNVFLTIVRERVYKSQSSMESPLVIFFESLVDSNSDQRSNYAN